MTDTARALKSFYSGFGLPAYSENDVPNDAELPYITYSVVAPGYLDAATHQARVWYRDTSPVNAYAKADEIAKAIGDGILLDNGVCLRPGTPLMQKQPTEDTMQVIYINLQINSYHMIGA